MSNKYLLELINIRKSFKRHTVLHDVSFGIKEGEILGIIGTSGGGKSTLFKILFGYYKPNKGHVLFKGKKLNLKAFKRIVGFTTQGPSFYKKLTIYENMKYYADLYNVKPKNISLKQHIHALLKQVRLLQYKNKLVEDISGGMMRRLNFAISLVHNPEILVLDEPTTGLDPKLVEEFWKIIRAVRAKGKTIIITSHIFPEVEKNCDRVVMLHKGNIAATFGKDKMNNLYTHFEQTLRRFE
jgi:ABC-2 type transport system ATP-binding protein